MVKKPKLQITLRERFAEIPHVFSEDKDGSVHLVAFFVGLIFLGMSFLIIVAKMTVMVIPLAILCAGAVAAFFVDCDGRRTMEMRKRNCQCAKCGYALTGNQSGTCPECAEPVYVDYQI